MLDEFDVYLKELYYYNSLSMNGYSCDLYKPTWDIAGSDSLQIYIKLICPHYQGDDQVHLKVL